MTVHLDEALYGDSPVVKDNKHSEYCSLVHIVFNTPNGLKLLEQFKSVLMSPIFHTDSHVLAMREGQRQVLIDLIKAYEEGKK